MFRFAEGPVVQTNITMITEDLVGYAKKGDLQSLKGRKVEDLISARYSSRMSLLMHAASCGHLNIVQYLYEAGCNVHMREDTDGLNAVHLAAKSGHVKVVEYLVNTAKYDLEAKSARGKTAFHFAVSADHIDTADFIRSKVTVQNDEILYTIFCEAVGAGHKNIVQYLLVNFQMDVNKKTLRGNTPVHLAARGGHFDILYDLIENHKADSSVQNDELKTPLHFAAEGGYVDIVMYLVGNVKVSTGVKDAHGSTPYDYVRNTLETAKLTISEFLLKYKSSQ